MGLVDRPCRGRLDHVERERRATVLGVALVVEVDVVAGLRDVLEVRARLRDRAVDGRLVLGIQREGLGEATVLGGVDGAVRHPGDEVVLHRQRAVLAREGRRGLARAREADDHRDALAAVGRDDLAAGVERDPAAVVHELVPHAEDPLLRLAEVVGVEDPVHALLEVDEDEPVVRPARRLELRRVDDRQLGLEALEIVDGEPQLLLHPGDVRVRRLDEEPDGDAELGLRAEPPVEQDHLLLGDVGVLLVRPLLRLLARDGAVDPGVGIVRDDERRGRRAREHLGLDVDVPVLRPARGRHPGGELLELGLAWIGDHPRCLRQLESHLGHARILAATRRRRSRLASCPNGALTRRRHTL